MSPLSQNINLVRKNYQEYTWKMAWSQRYLNKLFKYCSFKIENIMIIQKHEPTIWLLYGLILLVENDKNKNKRQQQCNFLIW